MDDHHFTAKSEKLKRKTLFLGPLIWRMLILKINRFNYKGLSKTYEKTLKFLFFARY
jgi:hypothetical protein